MKLKIMLVAAAMAGYAGFAAAQDFPFGGSVKDFLAAAKSAQADGSVAGKPVMMTGKTGLDSPAADVRRYGFTMRGKIYSWTKVLGSQPAILRGSFDVVLTANQAPKIQNLQATLKLSPANGLKGYSLQLASQNGRSIGDIEEDKNWGHTIFNMQAPASVDSNAANTVFEEILSRSGSGEVPNVDSTILFGFYCSSEDPNSCTAAKWSRIGFRLQGTTWIGSHSTDGMQFEVDTSSLDPIAPLVK